MKTGAVVATCGMLIAIGLFGAASARGNALSITNVTILNVSNGLADIQFDVSWSNGWNLTWSEDGGATVVTNHDAAWIFVKFRVGPGEWHQAWLAPTGHLATGGTTIDPGCNGGDANVGAYVYRAASGAGTVSCPGMRLKWAYTKNGLTGTNDVDISVHGIEVVYAPRSSFWLGAGGGDIAEFYQYPNTTSPYPITNEDAIAVGTNNGNLCYNPVDIYENYAHHVRGGDQIGPIPATFPKGYAAFYCMKYEISQGQYADFLNHAGGFAYTFFPNMYGSSRHTIHLVDGSYVADAPDRACNYLSWSDLAAYLDWAAMRPMTEMEFEKICRGPLTPVANENAWGSISLTPLAGISGSDGSGSETATPTDSNCHYGNGPVAGPVRVGIFATDESTRIAAGASYYGAMELSGNVGEIVISAGHSEGRAFAGEHGDGSLMARPASWPSASSLGVQSRGGAYDSVAEWHRTSNRREIYADAAWVAGRAAQFGGRGVRTAP